MSQPNTTICSEHAFESFDGTRIFYRAWLPAEGTRPTRAVLLFHRGHEHSGRWQETVDGLDLRDTAVLAWDQRGHGQSPGPRGGAPHIGAVVQDADRFARHVAATHGVPTHNTAVIASSVGAVIASAWVHDYAPPVRAMVLTAPALRVKLYVPLAIPALRLRERFFPGGNVASYVKSSVLTHDAAQAAAYDADPQIFRQIAVNVLLDLYDTSTRLIDDAGAIRTPTLILAAGNDWVVQLGAQRRFYERLGSPIKQFEVLTGFYHSVFHEQDRRVVVGRAREFLLDAFARQPAPGGPPPAPADDLIHADKGSYTRTEYDLLRAPGSPRWAVARAAVRSVGRLSRGVDLGCKVGFDSGITLDYIYDNRSRGTTPLGKLIDRSYLNAIGWRGIRVRRANLERVLQETIPRVHAAGTAVSILDIASGPGRYVLETIAAIRDVPITATLRDYQQPNLDAAERLIKALGLRNVTTTRADAFDRAGLAATTPKPSIAIVSGLYELFPENAPVLNSLRGIADCITDNGYLIYTCQPWHPQVEFIARVLTNREGKPWIMRRRSQAEMDALVAEAGFEKLEQDMDRWGIFTVSVAKRVNR